MGQSPYSRTAASNENANFFWLANSCSTTERRSFWRPPRFAHGSPLRYKGCMTHQSTNGSAAGTPFPMGDAQETLFAVMRHSGDCMSLVDLDGRVLRWNTAAEELYGWPQQDALDQVLPFVAPEQQLGFIGALREAAAAACVTDTEFASVRADGSRFLAHVALVPVHDQEGDAAGVVVILRDNVSDERFERQRSDFAMLVSDHLSGSLHALMAHARLLGRPELWADGQRRQAVLHALGESAAHATRIVDRLVLLSGLDRSAARSREQVDVAELLAAILSDIPAGRATAEIELGSASVPADRKTLEGALRALLDRSRRVSGRPETMSVNVLSDDSGCTIEILDPGWPVETDDDVRSYAPASAGPESAEASVAAAIARGVLEAHGGTMNVVREVKGARISLHLPGTQAPLTERAPAR